MQNPGLTVTLKSPHIRILSLGFINGTIGAAHGDVLIFSSVMMLTCRHWLCDQNCVLTCFCVWDICRLQVVTWKPCFYSVVDKILVSSEFYFKPEWIRQFGQLRLRLYEGEIVFDMYTVVRTGDIKGIEDQLLQLDLTWIQR